jgi:RNAse (barnase) inhibitor barstar
MSELELFHIGEPSLMVEDASASVGLIGVLPPSGTLVVARLDGSKMSGVDEIFGQFSDTLGFPAYFGWNWNALFDCLSDLSWRPADAYLIVVDRAEEMLSGRQEERSALFSVLSKAAREWANPLDKPSGQGVVFKVLLLAGGNAVETIRQEVHASRPARRL